MAGESALRFRRNRNALRFHPGILCCIFGEQGCHGGRISPHFLHRPREPFVDRTVHESISEPEHHEHRQKREQQAGNHQAGAEFRSQNAQSSFREELQKIPAENESEGDKQHENQGGKGGKKQ